MTWECQQFYETEEGNKENPVYDSAERIELIAQFLSGWKTDRSARSHWTRFIESYSVRQLTYDTDTLPAISGIVREIQRLIGDTYYAGLWKKHFLDGLLWRLEMSLGSAERVEGHPQTPRRRHEWIAPSWSWASVKGKITHLSWHSDIEYCAYLEECSVTHCGIDPFGAVKEGFVRLTGPVTLITDIQARGLNGRAPSCMVQLSKGTSTEGTVFLDFSHRTSCDVLMITLYYGICIEKVDHTTNTYVRIGVVNVEYLQHTGDNVVYDASGYPVKTGQWRPPTTSDHVPPRSIILV